MSFNPLTRLCLVVLLWTAGIAAAVAQKQRIVAQQSASRQAPAEGTVPANESADDLILRKKGIDPTVEGVRQYLQDIHITAEQKKEAAALIDLLGSDDYQVRREATRKLARFPGLPIEEFERAKQSADPETMYRMDMVARFLNASFGKTLGAVYRVIDDRHLTGLVPEIIRSEPFTLDDEALKKDYRRALVASATPADDEQLRDLLRSDSVDIQAAAVEGLFRSQKEKVTDLLRTIAGDPNRDDLVRFRASEALADMGDRTCLDTLLPLLESSNVNVRTWAGSTLQIATGVDQGYTGYAKDELRKAAVEKWKKWIAENRDSVKLRYPLKKFNDFESYLNGNTLLACGYVNKVIELNPNGTEVWSVTANGAWSAEKLKNGNVLVACYNQNRIVEYGVDSKEVWSYTCRSPLNVRPLKNGNVLISEYSGRRVIEVNRKKDIVWSYSADGSVADAIRLPSGNTLVATQSRIIEVDMKGKIVWEYPTNQPYGIQALKNGNVLIAKFTPGQVLEVNRKKEIVWQYDCKNPTDAMKLPNGNVLITENTRFIEVTRDKKIIWSRTGASCGAARR